jgi:hypothetical protein
VLKYGLATTGADATALYKAFHERYKKANLMLQSLPQRKPQLELQPGQLTSDSRTRARCCATLTGSSSSCATRASSSPPC